MDLLYLLTDAYAPEGLSFRTFDDFEPISECLVDCGFRVVITSWNHLKIQDESVWVCKGVEKTAAGTVRIEDPEPLEPALILDECPGTSAVIENPQNQKALNSLRQRGVLSSIPISERDLACAYIQYLLKTFWKNSVFTYDPVLAHCGKCALETYFKAADARLNEPIPRPYTQIALNADQALTQLSQQLSMADAIVVKSDLGSRSESVYVVTPETQAEFATTLKSLPPSSYVVQRFIADSVLYKGCKADLRINVAVYSWAPLRFQVFRQAKVRVANQPFSEKNLDNSANSITARAGYETATAYFSTLSNPQQVWIHIEHEIEKVLQAVLWGSGLEKDPLLNQLISFFGIDIILQDSPAGPMPLVLEINPKPGRLTVKNNEADLISDLLASYKTFFLTCKTYVKPNPRSY